MPDESTEVIEQKMNETRDSLAQKVSALETQVTDTIQSATATVTNMVEQVKTAVPDTIATMKDSFAEVKESVTEQMKATFDVSQHTRDRPWAMIGGAAALGFIGGMILFRRSYGPPEPARSTSTPSTFATSTSPAPAAAPMKLPGWLDQIVGKLSDRVSEEVRKLGEVAVATASASLQQTVERALPTLLGSPPAETQATNRISGADHNGVPAHLRM